jgi:hypothetical protein
VLHAKGGSAVFNASPIRYYAPGSRHVARPNAAPPIPLPRIAP